MRVISPFSSRGPRYALGLAVLALVGGCGTEPPVPATIALTPESLTLTEIGQNVELVALVKDENGRTLDGPEVFWSSSDTTVATVAGVGARALLTPVGNGTAIVSASIGTVEANVAVTVDISQRSVLLEIYRALGGDEWRRNLNWGTAAPLDMWHGVVTDSEGNVTGLELSSNGLSGLIPPVIPVIGMLESLHDLNLERNSLTGSIPPEIGNLPKLFALSLGGNSLTGSIPPEIGNLANLNYLSLGGNSLTGSIPPEIAKLQRLDRLFLSGNDLTGSIPPEIGNLPELRMLLVRYNALTGPIPPEFGRLHGLEYLDLGSNALAGPIPPELGWLQRLTRLRLDNNALTGAIPPELGRLQRLDQLHLDNNALTGAIPPELGRLQGLDQLHLDNNDLTGPLPPRLGNLRGLRTLTVDNTGLTGPIPRELMDLSLWKFHWNETDLCAPADSEFQQWLKSIFYLRGSRKCPP